MLGLPVSGRREVHALVERYELHAAPFTPVPIYQVVRDEGWHHRFYPAMPRLYGVGIVAEGVRVMFINGSVSRPWQRYAMAHELAHDLLGHRGWFTCRGDAAGAELRRAVLTREEVEANIGAAMILIPDVALGCGTLDEAAALCQVPLELMELRRAVGIGTWDRSWQVLALS